HRHGRISLAHDHQRHLPRRPQRHPHGAAAGGGSHQWRDRATAVHGAQQPVLEHQSRSSHGQPAGGDFPVCAQPLSELAAARVVRRADDHAEHSRPEHQRAPGAVLAQLRRQALMSASEVRFGARPGAVSEVTAVKFEVRHLDFYYGSVQALKDINLTLPDRRITAFIGPSGCGKSTLLRVFNRMYALYPGHRATGDVRLDGEDILAPTVDVATLRFKVGMVFQKATPFPMSVFDNVAFGLRLSRRISRSELGDRVEEALRDAAMWEEVKDKLHEDGRSLAGGQQQRLCIARTLAQRPASPRAAAAGAGSGNGDAVPESVARQRVGEGGLNLKPSGRMRTPASADAAAGQAEVAIENPVFSCRDVSVFYGVKQALKDVSLDVERRQVLAMIGPSGCGKSTFLRCLNRMNDTIPGAR